MPYSENCNHKKRTLELNEKTNKHRVDAKHTTVVKLLLLSDCHACTQFVAVVMELERSMHLAHTIVRLHGTHRKRK